MSYRLPHCLESGDDDRAVRYLEKYYGTSEGVPYIGSYFDGWAAQRSEPNRFTADDVVAVSFLSVFVPPLAARMLLDTESNHFAELLSAVGPDRDLADETDPIEGEWPASRLFDAVIGLPKVGRTIATKLCARKRPRLLPIYDSVVAEVTDVGYFHWDQSAPPCATRMAH